MDRVWEVKAGTTIDSLLLTQPNINLFSDLWWEGKATLEAKLFLECICCGGKETIRLPNLQLCFFFFAVPECFIGEENQAKGTFCCWIHKDFVCEMNEGLKREK